MHAEQAFDWHLDTEHWIIHLDPSCMSRLQLNESSVSISDWLAMLHPSDQPRIRELINHHQGLKQKHLSYEARALDTNGLYRWLRVQAFSHWDKSGQLIKQAGYLSDISESKNYDCLTGLPNHFFLENWLEQQQQPSLLALCKIRQTAELLQLCSRSEFDQLFCMLAWHLQSLSYRDVKRDKIAICTEYRIALNLQQNEDHLAAWVERANGFLSQLAKQHRLPIELSLDLGYCLIKAGDSTDQSLLNVQFALSCCQSHRALVRYDSKQQQAKQHRLNHIQRLRQALERQNFRLQLQPILALQSDSGHLTERSIGAQQFERPQKFELLLRWPDEADPLAPDQFICLAEELQLMDELGQQLFQTSTRLTEQIPELGQFAQLSLNISAQQFDHDRLPKQIEQWLNKSPNLQPSMLCLEITETAILKQPKAASMILNQIKELGVSIALDDFGSGYAALALLADLPLDSVKLDRSLLKGLTCNHRSQALVQGCIELCHRLGYQVIAEGIENRIQLDRLTSYGCDYGQGYYLAKPLWPEELSAWLELTHQQLAKPKLAGKKKQA